MPIVPICLALRAAVLSSPAKEKPPQWLGYKPLYLQEQDGN
jgi:hypothetical protein